jgi:hypothetical protein
MAEKQNGTVLFFNFSHFNFLYLHEQNLVISYKPKKKHIKFT